MHKMSIDIDGGVLQHSVLVLTPMVRVSLDFFIYF